VRFFVVRFGFGIFGWFFSGRKLEPPNVGCYGRVERWRQFGRPELFGNVRMSERVLDPKQT
jgi:hypothetical protein